VSQKSHTKDEKFMLALHATALQSGDAQAAFNRYQIGAKIGLHPKATDTICTLLLQANFIKKESAEEVYLSTNGMQLVQKILAE
jgi:hypothetical protein